MSTADAVPVNAPSKVCTCGQQELHRITCPRFERFEPGCRDFVGICGPRLAYIGVADRAKFDSIDLAVHDHGEHANGHLLTKADHSAHVTVIFQHWITQKTVMAMIADSDAAKGSQP